MKNTYLKTRVLYKYNYNRNMFVHFNIFNFLKILICNLKKFKKCLVVFLKPRNKTQKN